MVVQHRGPMLAARKSPRSAQATDGGGETTVDFDFPWRVCPYDSDRIPSRRKATLIDVGHARKRPCTCGRGWDTSIAPRPPRRNPQQRPQRTASPEAAPCELDAHAPANLGEVGGLEGGGCSREWGALQRRMRSGRRGKLFDLKNMVGTRSHSRGVTEYDPLRVPEGRRSDDDLTPRAYAGTGSERAATIVEVPMWGEGGPKTGGLIGVGSGARGGQAAGARAWGFAGNQSREPLPNRRSP